MTFPCLVVLLCRHSLSTPRIGQTTWRSCWVNLYVHGFDIYIYIYRNSIMWRLCDFLACWWKKFCTCSTIGSLYTCLFSTQATEQQSQAPQAPMVGEGIPCNQSYFYTINSLFNPGGGGSLGYNAASCAHEPWRLRLGTLVMSRFTRVGKQWIWNP